MPGAAALCEPFKSIQSPEIFHVDNSVFAFGKFDTPEYNAVTPFSIAQQKTDEYLFDKRWICNLDIDFGHKIPSPLAVPQLKTQN
jgi:hypothetical protein